MSKMSFSKRGSDLRRTLALSALVALAASYILFAGGCDQNNAQVVREEDESHFVRGKEELKKGNFKEALSAFTKVTEKRRDAPESHLDLGLIYLNNIKDPIEAIHHFRKYLELKPNSDQSQRVKQCMETAKKQYLSTAPGNPYDISAATLEMEETLRKLREENLKLKQDLAAARATIESLENSRVKVRETVERRTSASGSPIAIRQEQTVRATSPAPVQAQTAASQATSYTVQVGDTLSSISRKVYGTSNKWREIFNANREKLSTPQSLKPGQTLIIPR